MSHPSAPPAAFRSASASFIASRIASPPPTAPGADSGAKPPILIGQSAAKDADPTKDAIIAVAVAIP